MSFYIPGTKSICNTSDGFVGVNTLNPNYTLDVNGNINFTGNLLNNGSSFSPSTISSGQSSQILFNQSGASTGSSNLRFDVSSNSLLIGSSGAIFYNATGINFNSGLIPSNENLSIGTIENPWKSIYISTGTVFIGPTGALQINSNGLISSLGGFAAPYFQVGNINPGAGILLTEENNLLYFQNELGVVGPVSVFNSSTINPNDTYYSLTGNVGFGVTGPQQKIDVLGNIQASDTILATNFTGTNLNISSIEATSSTLNIATVNGETSIVNIGTSNSTQTVNIGTVGNGATTINLGGTGDTVNVAGTLVYVNSTTTQISNPQFIINQSGTNINNTGLTVSQNGGPTGAYILVNSSSDAWTLKAGNGQLVTLNQDVSNGASVNFSSGAFTNIVLNSDRIALGTNAGAQSTSVGIGYQALQTSSAPYAVAIGYEAAQTNNTAGYSVALGYQAGRTNQSENTIAVGWESGLLDQRRYAMSMGPQSGRTNQGSGCIALGYQSGYENQLTNAVAIGNSSGRTLQGTNAVAIGPGAGYLNQGANCVAIGNNAGNSNQATNSIVINAANANLNASTNGFFVNPVRNVSNSQLVQYNTSTNELTYSNNATLSNLTSTNSSLTNFTGTNGIVTNLTSTNSSLTNFTGTNGTVTNLTATTFTGTTMYTSNLISSNTVSANLFTGANVSTNKVIFDGVGSIYFQTGSATGCFITGLNYNTTGASHYVYYNNTTKELSQSSPNYF